MRTQIWLRFKQQGIAHRFFELRKVMLEKIPMDQHVIHIQILDAQITVPNIWRDHKYTARYCVVRHLLDIMIPLTAEDNIQFIKAVGMIPDGIVFVHKRLYVLKFLCAEIIGIIPVSFSRNHIQFWIIHHSSPA